MFITIIIGIKINAIHWINTLSYLNIYYSTFFVKQVKPDYHKKNPVYESVSSSCKEDLMSFEYLCAETRMVNYIQNISA